MGQHGEKASVARASVSRIMYVANIYLCTHGLSERLQIDINRCNNDRVCSTERIVGSRGMYINYIIEPYHR